MVKRIIQKMYQGRKKNGKAFGRAEDLANIEIKFPEMQIFFGGFLRAIRNPP